MNWNKDKSLKFTRVCIYFFAVLLVGICVGAPWLYRGFLELPLRDVVFNTLRRGILKGVF